MMHKSIILGKLCPCSCSGLLNFRSSSEICGPEERAMERKFLKGAPAPHLISNGIFFVIYCNTIFKSDWGGAPHICDMHNLFKINFI